jgi:dUTPase
MRLSAQFAVRLMEGASLRIVTPGDNAPRQPIRVNDRIAQLVIQRHCQADVRQYLLACQRLVAGAQGDSAWGFDL